MIKIDALLKDGRSALEDLDGSSPSGGFVRSEWHTRTRLTPGDVVRDGGAWSVVAGVAHDGIYGITVATLIGKDNTVQRRTLAQSDGAVVRTDARIDPDTLWRLGDLLTGRIWHVTAA